MSRIFRLLMVAVLAVGVTVLAQDRPESPSSTVQDSSPFPEIDTSAVSKISIPLRFPRFLPETGGAKIFAVVREAESGQYDILLATTLPCGGGNACTYGSAEGSKHSLDPVLGKTIQVALGKGIIGHFTASSCYAFCSQAYVRWEENGIFYSIGVKAGKRDDMVKAARSAIAAGRKDRPQHEGAQSLDPETRNNDTMAQTLLR